MKSHTQNYKPRTFKNNNVVQPKIRGFLIPLLIYVYKFGLALILKLYMPKHWLKKGKPLSPMCLDFNFASQGWYQRLLGWIWISKKNKR
jgi:hypothetical protein